MTKAIKLTPIF